MQPACCCPGRAELSDDPLSRRRKKKKELQTNLITDAIFPHCLISLLYRHMSAHLKDSDTRPRSDVLKCTFHIRNISLKGQIRLQIKIVWSHRGDIDTQQHKTVTYMSKHGQKRGIE